MLRLIFLVGGPEFVRSVPILVERNAELTYVLANMRLEGWRRTGCRYCCCVGTNCFRSVEMLECVNYEGFVFLGKMPRCLRSGFCLGLHFGSVG